MLAVYSDLSFFFAAFSVRDYWKIAELFLDLLLPNNYTYDGLKRGFNILTKILSISTIFTSSPNNFGLISSDLTTVSCTVFAPYSPLIILGNSFYQRMYYLQRTCHDNNNSNRRFGPKFAAKEMPDKLHACLGNESCQDKQKGTCCCMPIRILNEKELKMLPTIYKFLWVFRHCTTESLCKEVWYRICVKRDSNVPLEKEYQTKHYHSYPYWP